MLIVFIAGCSAPPPLPPPPEGAPPGFPSAALSRQMSAAARVLAVDPSASLVRVLVYRGGALARLGHDHVIAARELNGIVVLDSGAAGRTRASGELYTAFSALTVDEPALRSAAGFETEPSAEDRDGTKRNMLATFSAAEHPFVRVALEAGFDGGIGRERRIVPAQVTISLAGVERGFDVDVGVSAAEGVVAADGAFSIRHDDFGVEPFSVLGGALAVDDRIDIEFEVQAVAQASGETSAY